MRTVGKLCGDSREDSETDEIPGTSAKHAAIVGEVSSPASSCLFNFCKFHDLWILPVFVAESAYFLQRVGRTC